MSNQQHPITPPPELVQQWAAEHFRNCGWVDASGDTSGVRRAIATQAAQWGADQELDACVEWLGVAPVVYNNIDDLHPGSYLRDARRPQPPSLKEQALAVLNDCAHCLDGAHENTIRRALEALPE